MKILFLQHGFGYGGATKSLQVMQKGLFEKVEIHTITKKNKRLNKILQKEFIHSNGIIEIDIDGVYSYSEDISSEADFEKAKRYNPETIINYINKHNVDILHINSSVFSNILKAIKEKTNCKIVVHFREVLKHQGNHPIDKFIIEQTKLYADTIIGISNNEVSCFNSLEKIHILPNPHDFSETDQYINQSAIKTNEIKIGMCANFNPIKGHLVFLEAIQLINDYNKKHNLNISFKIIGYPIYKNRLLKFLKSVIGNRYLKSFETKLHQLQIKNLTLVPFTLDVYSVLSDIDIYVRPDLSGNPWGRDIIEAMAMQIPIVATGTSEVYIINGKTGYLVEASNPLKLAKKTIELLENVSLRNTLKKQAYVHVKQLCDLNAFSNNLLSIYNKLVSI